MCCAVSSDDAAGAATESMPWEGVPPAHFYLQARRDRLAAAGTKGQSGDSVHAQLRVQPAAELPKTIDEVMHRAPRKRAGRHR